MSQDAADLAAFGYRERLDRTLGGFSSFAAGFSYLSILTGLPQLFYLGYHAAGPAFCWTWPTVWCGQMTVACCFAELAAEMPVAGGVYQWASRLGIGATGWLAGWVSLACALVSMASVALALQGALPRIAPWFQWVGTMASPGDAARNAVFLGCGLIALTTAINMAGVRLLTRINNLGVFAELIGASLLVIMLFWASRRGASVVLDTRGLAVGRSVGAVGPFLLAALTPSFVMYGFDTAGSLAEETVNPRRQAPRAILGSLAAVGLMGGLLILGALEAAPDLSDPGLGRMGAGMPLIIHAAISPTWSRLLLLDVVVAIVICTLTVQAAAVRLIFAMARDNILPWSGALASLGGSVRAPQLPAQLVGLASIAILLVNVNSSSVVELLASVAIVWANLSYLFVTAPQLVRRWHDRTRGGANPARRLGDARLFHLGRWGLPINLVAVCWSVALVINVGWPRAEVYGEPWPRRFVAVWATLALLGVGWFSYGWSLRRGRPDVLAEHRAFSPQRAEGRPVGETEERFR